MAKLTDRFKSIADGNVGLGFDPLGSDEARLSNVRLDEIELDSTQPRKNLGDLDELAASIREHGIVQPLVVSPLDDTRYLLIAGERRFSAAKVAGLKTIPVLIRTVKDHHRLELQLIENLHRKDLDPFEEAEGYRRLKDEFGLTQEQVADRVGKSRTHVTQMLSLTGIPPQVREKCQSSDIRLARDTLYLIAKQETPKEMDRVLQDAQSGLPIEERRARARKGKPREETPGKKPKAVYTTRHEVKVILQSMDEYLTVDRKIGALKEALAQAKKEA